MIAGCAQIRESASQPREQIREREKNELDLQYSLRYECCEDLSDFGLSSTEEVFSLRTTVGNSIELVELGVKTSEIITLIEEVNSETVKEVYYRDKTNHWASANIIDNGDMVTLKFLSDNFEDSYRLEYESCADLSDFGGSSCAKVFELMSSTGEDNIKLVENDIKTEEIWINEDINDSEVYYLDEENKPQDANIGDDLEVHLTFSGRRLVVGG